VTVPCREPGAAALERGALCWVLQVFSISMLVEFTEAHKKLNVKKKKKKIKKKKKEKEKAGRGYNDIYTAWKCSRSTHG